MRNVDTQTVRTKPEEFIICSGFVSRTAVSGNGSVEEIPSAGGIELCVLAFFA
jgi:hypothetical protein